MIPESVPQIRVIGDSLKQNASGSITGVVYWQAGSLCFPDSNWSDFVVVISCWWVQAMVRLTQQSTTAERLLFMDGPFEVKLQLEGDRVRVSFVNRRHAEVEEVGASFRTGIQDLCRSISLALSGVLQACCAHNMRTAEVEELAVQVERLQQCKGVRS